MLSKMKILPLFAILGTLFFSVSAFAQELNVVDFTRQVLAAIKAFGGLPTAGKIALGISLLIASMKVSMLRPYWDKLGWAKPFLAPVLGLIGGIVAMLNDHGRGDWETVMAWTLSGAGAIIVHQLLGAIADIPTLKPKHRAMILWLKSKLGAPKSSINYTLAEKRSATATVAAAHRAEAAKSKK